MNEPHPTALQLLERHLATLTTQPEIWYSLFADDAVVAFPYAAGTTFPPRLNGKSAIVGHYEQAARCSRGESACRTHRPLSRIHRRHRADRPRYLRWPQGKGVSVRRTGTRGGPGITRFAWGEAAELPAVEAITGERPRSLSAFVAALARSSL
ncbi:hypothetical protein LZC95_14515 [Pendulispora brunnea]|uniref:SnoaL-like domain-containing protein n=1 Tax=Pendulispora brunnea TaxID=2905690 RepID=A0ABZ2KH87_9BACT